MWIATKKEVKDSGDRVTILMADIQALKYYVVDSFADSVFKGNPAAVCVLEMERDDKWMKAVGREFNLSATCFLIEEKHMNGTQTPTPRFRLRWFAPNAELNICGHGSIASAYVLFSTGRVQSNVIEFRTNSGVMLAEKIPFPKPTKAKGSHKYLLGFTSGNDFSVRLAFPIIPVVACDEHTEAHLIPNSLNAGAPGILNITKMAYEGELVVECTSGTHVAELQPSLDEIKKWPGRGVVATGAAPPGSGFDFYSRFFCPNLGMNEDPVCGSVHCGLAPYWSKKLGKKDLKAYMASPRGGMLVLHVDDKNQKVLIQGEVAPVMEGVLYA